MEVIPAVDVLGGAVVRLVGGDYARVIPYAADPVRQARRWVDQGAALVHVVDLDGARHGRPSPALWEGLAAAGVRFQVGGGIRDAATAARALDTGAERVVMGTAAVWAAETVSEVERLDRVVAAVDVRAGRATGAGWTDRGRAMGEVLDDLAGVGVGRVLVTGIGRDGRLVGPDLTLLDSVAADGRFAVIAGGGVGRLGDLAAVSRLGCEAVVVGRALYEGRFTLAEARAAAAAPA